ncbi:MAG: hypothetical protein ABSC51_12180, partial [Gaiellaceae bacterium]
CSITIGISGLIDAPNAVLPAFSLMPADRGAHCSLYPGAARTLGKASPRSPRRVLGQMALSERAAGRVVSMSDKIELNDAHLLLTGF